MRKTNSCDPLSLPPPPSYHLPPPRELRSIPLPCDAIGRIVSARFTIRTVAAGRVRPNLPSSLHHGPSRAHLAAPPLPLRPRREDGSGRLDRPARPRPNLGTSRKRARPGRTRAPPPSALPDRDRGRRQGLR